MVIVVRYRCAAMPFVKAQQMSNFPTLGEVVRLDPAINQLIATDAEIEVLAMGFDWSEGPGRVPRDGGDPLFSDVPKNTVFKWSEQEGLSEFLKPSGYTGIKRYSDEPGSNGLTLDGAGRLISCEHGDRRVSAMAFGEGKLTVADRYDGKRSTAPTMSSCVPRAMFTLPIHPTVCRTAKRTSIKSTASAACFACRMRGRGEPHQQGDDPTQWPRILTR